jgi:hypothetical protein
VTDHGPIVLETHERGDATMGIHDDAVFAGDAHRQEHRVGARAEQADEPLRNRWSTGLVGDGPESDELRVAVDVRVEHGDKLGDVTARARGNESIDDDRVM